MRSHEELKIPAVPVNPLNNTTAYYGTVPTWLMPMTYYIVNGYDSEEAVNGIGLGDDGDLLLYRRITPADWDKHPMLRGIKEVWITLDIPIQE